MKVQVLVIGIQGELIDTIESLMLKTFSAEVLKSYDRSEALGSLSERSFDLIIQDIDAFGIDWETFSLKAKKLLPAVKMIVMASNIDSLLVKRIEKLDALVLVKPFEMKVLGFLVARILFTDNSSEAR